MEERAFPLIDWRTVYLHRGPVEIEILAAMLDLYARGCLRLADGKKHGR